MHWVDVFDVFGNAVTAREIVEAASARGRTVAQYLRDMYAELGEENPNAGWDSASEPDFEALARQVLTEVGQA